MKSHLAKQIADHDAELAVVRAELENRVKKQLEGRLREYVTKEVHNSVVETIEKRVKQEVR